MIFVRQFSHSYGSNINGFLTKREKKEENRRNVPVEQPSSGIRDKNKKKAQNNKMEDMTDLIQSISRNSKLLSVKYPTVILICKTVCWKLTSVSVSLFSLLVSFNQWRSSAISSIH